MKEIDKFFCPETFIPGQVNCFGYWHVLYTGRLSANNFKTKSKIANSTRACSENCILYTFVLTYPEQGQNQYGKCPVLTTHIFIYVDTGKTIALTGMLIILEPSDKTIIPAVDFEKNLYSM